MSFVSVIIIDVVVGTWSSFCTTIVTRWYSCLPFEIQEKLALIWKLNGHFLQCDIHILCENSVWIIYTHNKKKKCIQCVKVFIHYYSDFSEIVFFLFY